MLVEKSNILIPREEYDMQKWAVIACDQHTSEKEYWDNLDKYVGDAPSTLRLILPEVYLGTKKDNPSSIIAAMSKYLSSDVFRTISDTYIYIERTLPSGLVRRGLIGAVNLDEYDYSAASTSLIRATEGTVESRLPARVEIRKRAPIELPHIMLFCEHDISVSNLELLYDFELSFDGGHITGYKCDADVSQINRLAVGDGNHSLAAAKLSGSHYALAEIVNIHQDSIIFEPIHRVIFNTDTSFVNNTIMHMDSVSEADEFCNSYISQHGGNIDYIHNDDTAIEFGKKEGNIAILLPPFNKNNLFYDVFNHGPYPKKSFSIGHACDKRYYLEAKEID